MVRAGRWGIFHRVMIMMSVEMEMENEDGWMDGFDDV